MICFDKYFIQEIYFIKGRCAVITDLCHHHFITDMLYFYYQLMFEML